MVSQYLDFGYIESTLKINRKKLDGGCKKALSSTFIKTPNEEVRLSITPVVLDLKNEDINIFGIVKSACMTEWMNAIYKVLKQSRKELLLILFQNFQTPADPKFGCIKGFGGFCKVRCGMTR